MNPSSNEAAGMQLPPPIAEQAPANSGPETQPGINPEQGPAAAPERAPSPAQPAGPAMAIPLPTPQIPAPVASQTDVPVTTQAAGPVMADDGDLIEKEWVNKAKHIVEHTRDDPYKQSEELTVVKADYMQKRYNKTIKLNK
jgi:hypothetical protein